MGDVVVLFRSQDRVDDPSGAAFRQRFRSRSHVRYSMKTFLSLVLAGSGGCSTLLVIPAARRRGTGSRGEISQGFALSVASQLSNNCNATSLVYINATSYI